MEYFQLAVYWMILGFIAFVILFLNWEYNNKKRKEMLTEEQQKVAEELKVLFGGKDPIKEFHDRLQGMTKEELIQLNLIAANRVGSFIKGNVEYTSAVDAAKHFAYGAEMITSSYDNALMNIEATTPDVGNA